MKKVIIFLLILFLMCPSVAVFAVESETPATEQVQDMSTPRMMVTSYSLDTKELTPSKESVLKITFHNFSETKALKNIKLTISDESGQIEIDGMGTKYVKRIAFGSDYVWEVRLTALPTAEIGKHKLTVASEYEDTNFSPFSSNDTVTLTVKQSVGVDYNGITMPNKIVEGETNTMAVTLMNTGKTDIRNCKLTFISDTLESSGTTFVGEIPAGESADANLNYKQPMGKLGEVSATVEISYEDVFGNKKSEKVTASSVVEKKVEVAEKAEDEKENKNPLWWMFILIGAVVGGAIGFGIPTAIRSSKQRKEDELRL